MLLPQSSAFAALKNRLNSVSSIGYLHIAPRTYVPPPNPSAPPSRQGSVVVGMAPFFQLQGPCRTPRLAGTDAHNSYHSSSAPAQAGSSNFERPNRLKGREDGIIRWGELLEKFRSVQERARRANRHAGDGDDGPNFGIGELRLGEGFEVKGPKERPPLVPAAVAKESAAQGSAAPAAKPRSGLGRQFGRLGGAVSGRTKRNP
jgi:vacuole morphology and inheritance protein 14